MAGQPGVGVRPSPANITLLIALVSLLSLQSPSFLRPEIFVAIGLCTHRACTPEQGGNDGFLCLCQTSKYDLAGRVFKVGRATADLVIPAYRFERL